ncbi:tryptophan synthase subunit alpha [Dethiobacter alkaliphilus]|uniref:tryptophan synthase subunit alpha n=1 Tax=Dethiobacter alkaliphilus TaxID=427926 RepID=UPI0022260239|nr:tryptophan synthase subunit alpha [Dethiobacter alkaliphilus]MCW3490770.1 tryptophan synthase subunit alpha [Dethiobacter alkaliphilus]
MNKLENKLEKIKASGQKALIPFLTAGDPDLSVTEKLMVTLAENGADVIELGIPYSDPLADGPVLQLAAGRALKAGTTTDGVLDLVKRFQNYNDTPVVLLVYFNQIYRRGIERFCREAAQAGVSALVVPDLPFEEAAELDSAAQAAGLINIRFLAPTTTDERLEKICKSARGFIYCVTVTGVTGKRTAMDPAVETLLQRAAKFTAVPLALGFGISDPGQAKIAAQSGDCVIVGSALVQKIAEANGEAKYDVAGSFIRSLKSAIEEGESHGGHQNRNCSACG